MIGIASRLIGRLLTHTSHLDATLARYMQALVSGLLTVILIMAILGIFGIETTSFAALLAGVGLAIGTAWGGLLAHFAAGVFMQIMRPFKIGDVVTAGGVTGTVSEIGIFTTTLIAGGNVQTIIGNSTIFGGIIQNYSVLPYRRVDCATKIANEVDPREAIEKLRAAVLAVPNVLTTPAPEITIDSFTPEGPLITVRPYTAPASYSQVLSDTNQAIADTLRTAGYPVPETPVGSRTR